MSEFLVKLGKSGNEIRGMLAEVYRDNAIKESSSLQVGDMFPEGRESVTDEGRSGRPAMSRTEGNIAKVKSNCA
jgi:hypothetical protein